MQAKQHSSGAPPGHGQAWLIDGAKTVTALITLLILVDARMPGQEASPKNPSLKLSEPVL